MTVSNKIITCIFLMHSFINNVISQSSPNAEEYMKAADVFKKAGKPDSAIVYYEKASVEFQNSRNAEGFVNAYNQIGIILTRQDKYDSAATYLKRALSRSRSLPDSNNLTIATTNISLGVLYSALEDYKQSLAYHYKALSIRLQLLGERHADVATSYGNIGNVYIRSKEYDKAVEAFLKAMEIRMKIFGENSPEIVESYNGLGRAYKEKKDYNSSLGYFEKALRNKIIQLGEKHKDLSRYYKSISDVYFLMGNKEQGDLYKAKAGEN